MPRTVLEFPSRRLWLEVQTFSPQEGAAIQGRPQTTPIDRKSARRTAQGPDGITIMKRFALEFGFETRLANGEALHT